MEQLLAFLFSNFYFVIILIFLIYAMFFRKSPLEKPENRPGRQLMDRPRGLPSQRPGGPLAERPSAEPARRASGRPQGPFAPADRMPDFGGSPFFPPKPSRRWEPKPQSVPDMDEGPAAGQRQLRPERREPEAYPELGAPIPIPVYTLPDPPAISKMTSNPTQPDTAMTDVYPTRDSDNPAEESAASLRAMADAPEAERTFELPSSRDELVRAVIWSEILGPPRARRPFRR